MTPTPKVFVCATSCDLASARRTAMKTLITLGCYPSEQDQFPTDQEMAMEQLLEKIAGCDAVLLISGFRFGAEPDQRPSGESRRSYARLAFDAAVKLGKPTYVFLAGKTFAFDDVTTTSEGSKRRALQRRFREALRNPGVANSWIISGIQVSDLQGHVERLKRYMTGLPEEIQARRHWLGIAIGVAALVFIGWGTLHLIKQRRRDFAITVEQSREASRALDDIRERMTLSSSWRQGLPPNARYQTALAEVAFAHKMEPARLGGFIDSFEGQMQTDSHATLYDQARVAFKNRQYAAAARLGKRAADEVLSRLKGMKNPEREAQRLSAVEDCILAGQAEYQQDHGDAALAFFRKAAGMTDKVRQARVWAEAQLGAACVLEAKGERNSAISLLEQIVQVRETQDTSGAPKMAIALDNLARLYLASGRQGEAEPLMRRALAVAEKSFGPDHPDVAAALHQLGEWLRDTGRQADAEPLLRRALTMDEKNLGPDHVDVSRDLNDLATLYFSAHRLAESEPLMRRALAIDEKRFGPEHPEVAIRLNNLGQLLRATNRLSEAEPLMRRALKIDEQSFGLDNPDLAIDLHNLALLLKDTHRLTEAEPLMQRAMAILVKYSQRTGHEHPDLQEVVVNYAGLLKKMGVSEDDRSSRISAMLARSGAPLTEQ